MDPKTYMRLINTEREKLFKRIHARDPKLADSLVSLPWYKVRNSASTEDTTEVLIYEEIGGYFWGISAEDLVRELNDITTSKISVRINSPGGSVFDSIAIYNALVKHAAEVTIYVDSLAASGASIIAQAGDNRVMMVGSQMMIHDASGVGIGNEAELREMADFLGFESDNIALIYANHAGGDSAEWRTRMRNETWMLAPEAVELGLADEIYTKPAKSEKDKPAEEDKPEPEESEEDGAEEETDTEPAKSTEDEDDELENILRRQHAIMNYSFKHNGRRRAPAPTNLVGALSSASDSEVDSILSAWNKFGGK